MIFPICCCKFKIFNVFNILQERYFEGANDFMDFTSQYFVWTTWPKKRWPKNFCTLNFNAQNNEMPLAFIMLLFLSISSLLSVFKLFFFRNYLRNWNLHFNLLLSSWINVCKNAGTWFPVVSDISFGIK